MMKKWSSRRSRRKSVQPEREPSSLQEVYTANAGSRSHSQLSLDSQSTLNAPITSTMVGSESHSSLQSSVSQGNSNTFGSASQTNTSKANGSTLQLSMSSLNVSSKSRPFTYENYDTTVVKTGWINKGHNITNWSNTSSDSWRIYKAVLEGPVLSLYKLPQELNIKSFDVKSSAHNHNYHHDNNPNNGGITGSSSASNNNNINDISDIHSLRQKRMSQISRSDLKASIRAQKAQLEQEDSKTDASSKKLKYLSEVYPHPDLQLSETNSITSGTLEAMCHTVLFNTLHDDKLSYNLLMVLPVFGDPKDYLRYFNAYANAFIAQGRVTRSNPGSKIVVSNNTDYAVRQRLGLVVTTFIDSFPGMLLDDEISELLFSLVKGLSSYDERLAHKLKIDLTHRQTYMKNLTSYKSSPYNPSGSKDLTIVENFLKLDPKHLAEQINIIDLKFNSLWNPKSDASLLYELKNLTYPRMNPLIFNYNTNIHYLGRLIVTHLFAVHDPIHGEVQRSRVLERWIEIGCIFDKMGDMVSWLAIATLICSVPILRLKKTWSLVDERLLNIISSEWAPVVFELDRRNIVCEASHRSSYHVIAPQGLGETYSKEDVVPYFGDLTVKFVPNSPLKQCEKKVQRVKISFSRWDDYLSMVTDVESLKPRPKVEDESLQSQLYNFLSNHVSLEPLTLSSVMEFSISSEPASVGAFHHDEARAPLTTGSFLPVLFTEIIPSYKIFNQKILIGAGGFAMRSDLDDTGSSDTMKLTREQQNGFIKSVKNTLGCGSNKLLVGEDLVFKPILTQNDTKKNPSLILLENPSSRRLSMISNSRFSEIALADADNDDNALANGVFAGLDSSDVLNTLIKPLNVAFNAGTFDKMVDVLVLTANVFSKKIKRSEAEKFLLKSNLLDNQYVKLKMDNGVYTSTFFATYKSFATTAQLIEALSKRFSGSKSVSISISHLNSNSDSTFPDWDKNVSSSSPELNWSFVGNVQIGVLEALSILVTDHYADFTDDLKNKQLFIDLLRLIDREIVIVWPETLAQTPDDSEVKTELSNLYAVLSTLYKKIRKSFIKRCYRPLDLFPEQLNSSVDSLCMVPLPKALGEAELFVEKLDSFVNHLSSAVTTSDWIEVSEIIESQTGSSLIGFYRYKSSSNDLEKLQILNIFSWIKTLYSDKPDDLIIDRVPPTVRTLLNAHDNLEKYFKLQIVNTTISKDERIANIQAILQILSIARFRMRGAAIFDESCESEFGIASTIPSFIESAILQAIVSPESRAFQGSWYSVSGSHTSISELLTDLNTQDLSENMKSPLTPCPGWFIERLMEVSNCVPHHALIDTNLINFDKRRFTYNCVSNIMALYYASNRESVEAENNDYGFILKSNLVILPKFNDVLETAQLENTEHTTTKLFDRTLEFEIEKNMRDALKRDDLNNQQMEFKRSQLLAQASRLSAFGSNEHLSLSNDSQRRSRQTNISPSKSTGMKRLGGLLKSVRPFSISVGSGWSGSDRVVHPDELPDVNQVDLNGKLSKPYQQITLFHHKPLFVHSNIEGFFKIVSENSGEEYYFQATSNSEAQSWISALNMCKRYTYLSSDAQGLTSSKVFGVPISDVCDREGTLVPVVVEKLLSEIEKRGLDETGLYRIPGSVGNINLLKQAFDQGEEVSLNHDIHTIAGCFKAYLRDLPESLFTSVLLPEFVSSTKSGDLTQNLRVLLVQLPEHNYQVLQRLFGHLHKVVQHSDSNRMDAVNLAIVFSMSFIDGDNVGFSMGSDLGALQSILQCMIKDPDSVFAG